MLTKGRGVAFGSDNLSSEITDLDLRKRAAVTFFYEDLSYKVALLL